jgi:hypothetical protein
MNREKNDIIQFASSQILGFCALNDVIFPTSFFVISVELCITNSNKTQNYNGCALPANPWSLVGAWKR